MSAQIKQIVTAGTSRLEVAEQDYELSKREFRIALMTGTTSDPKHQERFQAAMRRQGAARENYLKALGHRA